ncbi:MAG: bacterioferritin [Rhodopirellula sp. JB044]|uniref:bacterioferritin n=1 Tax=Rhodopirellula sp. JB044 TaxID=3342844 RepID=UPI00370C89F9
MSSTQTIQNLQKALEMELSATHQYQLHAGVLDEWGMGILADQMREEMQEELGHSQEFMTRLLFHGADPELKLEKTPVRARSLKEMFELDLSDEKEALAFYTKSSVEAAAEGDLGSKQLFERIALDEEEHMGWLELQLDLLERMGEPAYIAKHMPIGSSS